MAPIDVVDCWWKCASDDKVSSDTGRLKNGCKRFLYYCVIYAEEEDELRRSIAPLPSLGVSLINAI